ncbi:MAG: MEDS domain-containing protein [Candidatus Omnitrophica bacterium]|nr:MEDS domain-containing protein [Candidatus Omnitrophota bacterium]
MMPSSRIPATLVAHEHAYHIYLSPCDLFNVILPYLMYGLSKGEKCMYALDDSTPDEVRDALAARGCDARVYEKLELLEILSTRDTYFGFGMFSGAAMLAYYRAYVPALLGRRFKGLRIAVELSDSLVRANTEKEFVLYETRVNDLFSTHPASAICAYNGAKFSQGFLKQIGESHPFQTTVECPYLPSKNPQCFHVGDRPDMQNEADRYCFDAAQKFRSCPVFEELKAEAPSSAN